jgi:hypothetical protein
LTLRKAIVSVGMSEVEEEEIMKWEPLLQWILSLPPEIAGFIIFGHMLGQNRNKILAAVMLYAVSDSHVRVPKQKSLECSYSYMECDRTHSEIEREKVNESVYCLAGRIKKFRDARKGRKCNRHEGTYM